MSIRLALGCSMRVGKDTATDYLLKHMGENSFKRLSFAKPLYDIMYYAEDICDIPRYKDRKFLQLIGTQWARAKNPNVWINCMKREIESSDNKNMIITDVRFENEFNFCRENGFSLIKINREGCETNSLDSNTEESPLFEALRNDELFIRDTLIYAQDVCGFERDYYDKLFYNIIDNYSEYQYDFSKHKSESLKESSVRWDYEIDNNSDLNSFYKNLDIILYNIN